MGRIEIGTVRQRIRHRSFPGIAFDRDDIARLVEYVRPVFFHGGVTREDKERIRVILTGPPREVEMPDVVWSGYFLQHSPYRHDGPQDPIEIMIRLRIDLKTPLKDYRAQLEKALDILIYDKKFRIEIFKFILAERAKFQKKKKVFLSEQSFFDDWFRYMVDLREDELQVVLATEDRGRRKWKERFPTATPYLTRLPDHVILSVTMALLDEIGCAPDDPDTLKVRFDRWKRRASPGNTPPR